MKELVRRVKEKNVSEANEIDAHKQKYRRVIIEPSGRGFMVLAGCFKAYFPTPEDLLGAVTDYYLNPDDWELEFGERLPTPVPEAIPRNCIR